MATTVLATKQAAKKLAATLGARIEFRADLEKLEHEIVIDSPDGCVWLASGVHQLVVAGADGTTWPELYQDAFERMSYGVGPCDVDDCDICDGELA